MGRGRQKAKQAKVARALKYETGSIDITALQAELATSKSSASDDYPEDGDYSAWIDDEEDEEDEDK